MQLVKPTPEKSRSSLELSIRDAAVTAVAAGAVGVGVGALAGGFPGAVVVGALGALIASASTASRS